MDTEVKNLLDPDRRRDERLKESHTLSPDDAASDALAVGAISLYGVGGHNSVLGGGTSLHQVVGSVVIRLRLLTKLENHPSAAKAMSSCWSYVTDKSVPFQILLLELWHATGGSPTPGIQGLGVT